MLNELEFYDVDPEDETDSDDDDPGGDDDPESQERTLKALAE